jgi:hypothetical protein
LAHELKSLGAYTFALHRSNGRSFTIDFRTDYDPKAKLACAPRASRRAFAGSHTLISFDAAGCDGIEFEIERNGRWHATNAFLARTGEAVRWRAVALATSRSPPARETTEWRPDGGAELAWQPRAFRAAKRGGDWRCHEDTPTDSDAPAYVLRFHLRARRAGGRRRPPAAGGGVATYRESGPVREPQLSCETTSGVNKRSTSWRQSMRVHASGLGFTTHFSQVA